MSRTKRFFDGVVLNYGNQALVMVVGLWLTPFLLHHLGQHEYGVWLVALQSLTYLSLLDIGVIGLLPREVAYLSGRVHQGTDPKELRELIEENTVVVLWQTPFVALAMTAVWYLIHSRLGGLQDVLFIILGTYAVQFPLRIFFAALEGLQDFGYIGSLQILAWAAGVIVNVVLVYLGFGLYGLAIGWSITQAIIVGGSIVRMYSRFLEFAPRRLRWLAFRRIRAYLQSGLWISISQITQMLVRGADVVLLASVSGPSAVVPYSCSSKLQIVLANQPQVILQAAQPGLTQLRSSATHGHISRVIGTLAQAMLMASGAVAVVILAVNRGFVQKWVGPDQYLGFWFTVAIAAGMLLRHLNTTTVYSLFCFGKERFISIIGFCEAVCFALLTYIFVRKMGTIGVPIASLASVSLASLPWTLHKLQAVTGVSIWAQLAPVRQWFWPFILVGTAVGVLARLYTPAGYLTCGVLASIVGLIYVAAEFHVIQESLWGARLKNLAAQFLGRTASLTESLWGVRAGKSTEPEMR